MRKTHRTPAEQVSERARYDETTRRLLERIERGRALEPHAAGVDGDETNALVLEALTELHRLISAMDEAFRPEAPPSERASDDLGIRLAAAAERYRALVEAKRRASS